MAATRRKWVVIAFGIAVLLVFIGIGAIIAVTAWVQQNLESRTSTDAEAQAEFENVRKQFPGRAPLLEIRDGRPAYGPGHSAPATGTPGSLSTLHVLVWDRREERLARFAIPFWLLRMKSGPIEFGSYASGLDDNHVNLRPEDIERHGPGIILDTELEREHTYVLLWAQ